MNILNKIQNIIETCTIKIRILRLQILLFDRDTLVLINIKNLKGVCV